MRQVSRVFIIAFGIAVASLASGTALAQTTSTGTEVKQFQVISVNGNVVVVRGENGAAQEITVPDDFRLTVDGKPVSVRELTPGMRGTARITTTTTVTPVTVTEVKKGKVLKVVGNSIIVRTEKGNQIFSEGDTAARGVKLNNAQGKPIAFSELREGYELTATIVTQMPPRVMTEREVEAALNSVAAPAASAQVARAAPSAAPASAAAPARTLPKTASPLPLIGLVGSLALTLAGLLTARRRRE